MIKAFDNFFSNSGSKSFWGTKSLQGTEDNKRIRISMSMNWRITHILAVFFPSLPPYPSSSHYTTWSLLSKKESPSWGCFNDIWYARFKCWLASTLAEACPGWHLFSGLQEQIQNYLGGLKNRRSRSHLGTHIENTVINSNIHRRREIKTWV